MWHQRGNRLDLGRCAVGLRASQRRGISIRASLHQHLVLERRNKQLMIEYVAAEHRLNEISMMKAQLATQRAELDLRYEAGMPVSALEQEMAEE